MSTTEIDLHGIGGHFTTGDTEHSSEHVQDQMVMTSDGDMEPTYGQWFGSAPGLSPFESLGTNGSQDGDYESQLWSGRGILLTFRNVDAMLTFSKEVSTSRFQDIEVSVGACENAFDGGDSWTTPIDNQAPSFDVAARTDLAWTTIPQGYSSLGDDNNASEQRMYGFGSPSPANQYMWSQDWLSADLSQTLSSPSMKTIPGLANSFRTVSDVSENQITSSGRFPVDFAESAQMEKQATFSGFATADTTTNMPCYQNNVKEPPMGSGLGFDFDAVPDSTSFQQYPEPLDMLAANPLSDGLFEAGTIPTLGKPARNSPTHHERQIVN